MRIDDDTQRSEVRDQKSAVEIRASVLECGGPPLLFLGPGSQRLATIRRSFVDDVKLDQSARGQSFVHRSSVTAKGAHSKTWRTAVAFGGLLSIFCVSVQPQAYSLNDLALTIENRIERNP